MAVDRRNGDVYIVGLVFGSSTGSSFVVKYDASGTLLWTTTVPSNNNDNPIGIDINPRTKQVIVLGDMTVATAGMSSCTR